MIRTPEVVCQQSDLSQFSYLIAQIAQYTKKIVCNVLDSKLAIRYQAEISLKVKKIEF